MARQHWLEATGLALIGDGLVGALYPRRHLELWQGGPEWRRRLFGTLAAHPAPMRVAFAAEAALGLWLARRELGQQPAAAREVEPEQ